MELVEHIGVVVPAKDEEALLPACLHALATAAGHVQVQVHIVVVLDNCRDRSDLAVLRGMRAARGVDIRSITLDANCVGLARALGMADLLGRLPPQRTWLATTDADSTVPPHWLVSHLARAADGYDVVVGTVAVDDWSEHPDSVRVRAIAEYAAAPHRHVHGTNVGFTADSYVVAGGFAALAVDEDVALVAAFEAAGQRIAWADEAPVLTSARQTARAPGGFADYLVALAAPPADSNAVPQPGREMPTLAATRGST